MTLSIYKTKWPKSGHHTHARAKVIKLADLATFLEHSGLKVLSLDQRWRHVHGIVKQDGRTFFLKLASTPEIGARTKNEVDWNRKVSNRLLELSGGMLVVPKIYRTGHYQSCFFYLADYYKGRFPADHDPPRTASLAKHLPSLIKVGLQLNALRSKALWNIDGNRGPKALVSRFFKEIDRWIRDSGRRDLRALRRLVEPLKANYHPRISHGDFVPWHVIIKGRQAILIDGEHAWSGRARYYDAAYFYHRVSTSAARPDLAKKFLLGFRHGLSKGEQSTFEELFIPVLAARSIAGFYDSTLFEDQKKVLSKHEELKDMILSHALW